MSEISFLYAPIGGGKSLFASRAVAEELRKGERMIVTNLPMWYDDAPKDHLSLAEWCHKYAQSPVDVRKRVRLLQRDEVFDFWLHYPGFDLKNVKRATRKLEGHNVVEQLENVPDLETRQEMQSAGKIPHGCFFVIDEVHLYFGARDWQKIGSSVEHYMSQLRKLNDDLFLVTQHPGKVDKNFRRNSTEWIHLQNLSKVRLVGGVSFKNRFRFQIFNAEPIRGDEPQRKGWIALEDKEYHKIYDTMSGVGLSGKLLPEAAKARGGHWSRWIVLMILVMAVAFTVPKMAMTAIGKGVHRALGGFESAVAGAVPGVGGKGSVIPAPQAVASGAVAQSTFEQTAGVFRSRSAVPTNADGVLWIGYSVKQGRIEVYLSDGQTFRANDGHLTFVASRHVIIDGERYNWGVLESSSSGIAPAAGSREGINLGKKEMPASGSKSDAGVVGDKVPMVQPKILIGGPLRPGADRSD